MMNSPNKSWLSWILALLTVFTFPLFGQDEDTYVLDPFSVVAGDEKGYAATNSISATRVNTTIKDIPVPVNIITADFIKDFAYTKVEDAVVADATITKVGRNEGQFAEKLKNQARDISMPLDTPDIMPTLLGLAGVPIPDEVEGLDRSSMVLGNESPDTDHAALQKQLDDRLGELLKNRRDEFLSGPELVARSGYVVDPKNETVDYNIPFNPSNITKSPIG